MRHRLPVVVFISIIVILSSIIVVASARRMSFLPTQLDRMITQPQVVPTTSNPTISIANGGLRTMANTSFENTDSSCGVALNTWAYIRMDHMRGWKTAHPAVQEKCNAGTSFGTVARVIELNYYTTPPDGTKYASLNADVASFLYQTLCVENGDSFDFQFYHNVGGSSRTDIASFRLGIPSGLPSGSVAADIYDREVLRASTTVGGTQFAATSAVIAQQSTDNSNSSATIVSGWGVYGARHKLPNTGWSGLRNIGFFGIQSVCPGCGNLLDKITLGLVPFIDLGSSRDRTALEGASATALNVRVNGRVTSGTKIAIRRKLDNPGPATSDTDFTLGTPTAGIYGNATVTHTAGSDLWLITIPPGDYDGGLYPGNNVGGLTIPITFLTDSASEGTEWAWFELARPTKDGSSPYFSSDYSTVTGEWAFSDPTCDGSFKSDGVVYSITENADTPTPTNSRTATGTRTNTPTRTATNTATNTPTRTDTNTPTNTPTLTNSRTNTPSNTPSNTPTNTFTPTDTATATDTPTPTNTPTATFTRTITPSPGPFAQVKAAIGDLFVLGLLQNGTLVSWGISEPGINQSVIPAPLRALLFKDIAASVANGFALTEDGNLYTWGENLYGEGNIPVSAQTNIKAIGAGARFAFAIRNDLTVVAWGRNEWGQATVPATATDVIAIDGGDRHAVALKSNGTVVAWGDNRLGQAAVPAGLIGVTAVSAGENHTLALLDTGRVIGWGNNAKGQISIPASVTDIVKIAAGRECSLAIKADGTLITWGEFRYINFPVDVRYNPIVAIDSGNQNSVVSTRNGQIYVAGNNLSGIMTSRTPTSPPLITETPSLTRVPTESYTPSLTRSRTPTRSLTPSRTVPRTLTPSNSRTKTPSRTKFPTWTHSRTRTP